MRLAQLLSIALLSSVAVCGGSSDSPTGTNGTNGTNNASGPMSATIDGKAWASLAPAVSLQNTIVAIAGIDNGLTTSISMGFNAPTTGTYSFVLNSGSGAVAIVTKSAGSQGFSTAAQTGAGSVTLTTLTTHHVVGTFAFDAVGSPATLGIVHVTNGKFDITF